LKISKHALPDIARARRPNFFAAIGLRAGAVIVIIDGMGSAYLAGQSATYAGGMPIDAVDMRSFEAADAYYRLKVPVPATEYGHAVIVTGYSNVSPEEITYYHATIFDALHDEGYLALGILENGDSKEMIGELDAAVRENNHSIYNPEFQFITNEPDVPSNVARMMEGHPRLTKTKAGKDPYEPYIRYNSWALGFARDAVAYMNESGQGADYVLIVNAGGLDSAGQNLGYDGYRAVLEGMDEGLMALVETCRSSGTILMITADHGMSFPDDTGRARMRTQWRHPGTRACWCRCSYTLTCLWKTAARMARNAWRRRFFRSSTSRTR